MSKPSTLCDCVVVRLGCYLNLASPTPFIVTKLYTLLCQDLIVYCKTDRYVFNGVSYEPDEKTIYLRFIVC